MGRVWFAAALALSFTLCGLSLASPALAADRPGPIDTIQADWLVEPSFEDLAKAYPPAARDQGVSGHTDLNCALGAHGRLSACTVANETPVGMGFGPAALSLADRFRMKPDAAKAATVTSSRITVPIRWAIVMEPDWVTQPSGGVLESLFPRVALLNGIGGRAVIECRVKGDGRVADCIVLSEAPLGLGFGAATIQAAREFRMKPETLDGKAVEGGLVLIPLTWKVYGGVNAHGGVVAVALSVMTSPKDAKPDERIVDCPTAANAARKCVTHIIDWEESPSAAQISATLDQYKLKSGNGRLLCTVAEKGVLKDCEVGGKPTADEEAAMRSLAGRLKPMSRSEDGVVRTLGSRLLIVFSFKELRMEAKLAGK